MRNKDTLINELIEKYNVTDDELRQITEVSSLWADMTIDKRKNLLKWTTVFDKTMRKALLKLRPDIDDGELRIAFNKFVKETTINELIEKYNVTDDELRQITEVSSLWADMTIDKRKNLLKWTTVFDKTMRKALLKLRPDIDDGELRIAFNKFVKETTVQINLNDMDRLLFTIFKQGVEYQKTLNSYE